ncbi:winged helix-turn-helix domain-containing protein [Tahibacter amnicola]|uniref:Winged helix-turn-helix domain-containing protein n=1 Tax=Tahibacter amnicola TaxID=2976241 RepID=A0ABY6BIX1_9GAMM|nr:winged helix-turn-helix domain-containing protein [Tahibacter amnicola]UXI69526.1 winged helix-turn-helix domain-containing protein [Tahibacter amnicola]
MSANVRILRPQDQTRFARLGDWLVDLASNRLLRGERELRPTPKAMAVLRQLMLAAGAPLTRAELLDTVWRDAYPTDDVLTHAITELRRAIEEDPKAPRHIETIPKVGYRLLTPVEWLEQLPGPPGQAADVPAAVTESRPEPPMRRPTALWVVIALLLLTAVLAPTIGNRGSIATGPGTRNRLLEQVTLPVRPVTAENDSETFPSISPDGTLVAYMTRYVDDDAPRIYLRGLSGSPPIRLSRTNGGEETYPVWSPDGSQIAFLRLSGDECRIVVIASLGGRERDVAACEPRNIDYFDWTRDGRALIVSRRRAEENAPPAGEEAKSLHLIVLDDGKITPLKYATNSHLPDIQPRMSPDGKYIAFRRGAVPYSDLHLVAAEGGNVRQLTRLRSRMRGYDWMPDSRHLLVSSDHEGVQKLYLLHIESGELLGLGVAGASYPAISRGRSLAVFQQDSADINLQSFRFDAAPDASGEGIASSTRGEAWPAFAPNDDRLVFVSDRGGDSQLWLFEPGARTSYQLTHHKTADLTAPNWAPDGRRVLYVARSNGHSRLYSVEVDSGQTRAESEESDNVRFGIYSADGQSIYYISDRGGAWNIWQRSLDRNTTQRLSDATAYNLSDRVGDGKIYFSSMSRNGIYAIDPATGTEELISSAVEYWNSNAWRVDPTGLYYVAAGSDMKSMLYFEPWSGGPAKLLRIFDGVMPDAGFTLDKDATRVVMPVVARDDTDVMLLDLALLGHEETAR